MKHPCDNCHEKEKPKVTPTLCPNGLKIYQPHHLPRFSIDSYLLAAHINPFSHSSRDHCERGQGNLEIGAASGIISLLLAQKFTEQTFYALELKKQWQPWLSMTKKYAKMRNFQPLTGDFNSVPFSQPKFSTIFSNPPYLNPKCGKIPRSRLKRDFKFTFTLQFSEIFEHSRELLHKTGGRLYLIFPFRELDQINQISKKYGYATLFRRRIFSTFEERKGWDICSYQIECNRSKCNRFRQLKTVHLHLRGGKSPLLTTIESFTELIPDFYHDQE